MTGSLIGALRRNADLAEKSSEFHSDPDLAEEAREDADFWRRCAAELEKIGKRCSRNEEVARDAIKFAGEVYGWAVHEPNTRRLREQIETLDRRLADG